MDAVRATSSGYWYGSDQRVRVGVDALNALRRYRVAESAMRKRTRDAMRMNETDMLAVRFLVNAASADRQVSPKDMAAHLGISSASTTVLIDRLVSMGHVQRAPHPSDGRGVLITVTPGAHGKLRETFGDMHRRMMEVANELTPQEADIVTAFLERMSAAVLAEEK
jgi:DNA-binding MarR family transcriptional regulator